MHLVLVGLSHHKTPIAVRERLSCSEQSLPAALTAIAARPGVREAVLLSTCNRMEVYALIDADDLTGACATLRHHLSAFHAVPESVFAPALYYKADQDLATHLLRVASGLDSLVVGEAQILGQVRTALRAAQDAGTAGGILNTLFRHAIEAGKRVHTETALSRGAFSIGHAAVDLARSIFADLSRAGVLVLGAGKMSELTARHLVDNGVQVVIVANRTLVRAEALAARLGGKAIRYDTFLEQLAHTDIVISSTAAPHPILRRETLAPILRRRRGRPLFLIDIAVPRDVDPDVMELDNVFLYNIDDLQEVVASEARGREGEVVKAEAIVEEGVVAFLSWYRIRAAAPVITELRERLDQILQNRLEILRARLGPVSEREWQIIETQTRALLDEVARGPILRLKQHLHDDACDAGAEPVRYDLLDATREIFGLTGEKPDRPTDEHAARDKTEVERT